MEKIKEAFTGKSKEERVAERETGHTAASMTPAHPTSGTYGEKGAYGAGGTEYTGGAAGGPAYGTAATGYTEGATGLTETETRVGTVEVPVVQQTTTTTTGAAEAGVAAQGEAAVCAQEYFTKVEDRPVVKERVEMIKEHRPVEKEFVVETRQTGVERELPAGEVEHLGTTERIVSVTPPSAPCE